MLLKIEAETTIDSDPCVCAYDDKLYVGTEEGSIKSFDVNLAPGPSWSAHSVQLFALAVGNGNVYSASNDGGVRIWNTKGEKVGELPSTGGDVGVLRVFGNRLYVGDEMGNVLIYENHSELARYNLIEEVKDIALWPPFMFTVRDLDVTVTEITPDESKSRYISRHIFEGRAPLCIAGSRLLVMARGGNNLRLYHVTAESNWKQLYEVKVSDMIVTSLAANGDFVWTGGWDGVVRRWKVYNDQLESAGELPLGSCINGLAAKSSEETYAVLSGGRIVRIKNI